MLNIIYNCYLFFLFRKAFFHKILDKYVQFSFRLEAIWNTSNSKEPMLKIGKEEIKIAVNSVIEACNKYDIVKAVTCKLFSILKTLTPLVLCFS